MARCFVLVQGEGAPSAPSRPSKWGARAPHSLAVGDSLGFWNLIPARILSGWDLELLRLQIALCFSFAFRIRLPRKQASPQQDKADHRDQYDDAE